MSLRCVGTCQEDVTAQCSLGILCKLGNRGRTHSSSPRVPQDNSEITLLMQRSFSHYQVTEFLAHWTMSPWEKAPGKKKIGFYSTFIQLFIVITSLPSERSPVFYHSLPGCDLDFSLQWCMLRVRKNATRKAYDPGWGGKRTTISS